MIRLSFILSLYLVGCSSNEQNPIANYKTQEKFSLPVIVNNINIDTVHPYVSKSVRPVSPKLVGKYKFGDTIIYNAQRQRENLTEKEYMWEVKNSTDSDTLSSDGLQIIPDYTTSLAYEWYDTKKYLYFPVYVVNSTPEVKIFFGKDSHGFAIQEALDTSEYPQWYPIEAEESDFCGNGRFRKKIYPGEFLMFLFPKYSGSIKTSLRVRFEIGGSIFISKPFYGIIDPLQFNVEESWIVNGLKETKGMGRYQLFYGAWPKGSWK